MSHQVELTHSEALMLICDALGEDLDAPICVELEKHFLSCPNCRIYYSTLKRVIELYQKVEAEEEMPAGVKERLFQALDVRGDLDDPD
jgi:predicted anti-sigma-YlaC factor YlaD